MPPSPLERTTPADVAGETAHKEAGMMTGGDRESFATHVIEEVRRWPGVELRPHASATTPGETDGVEFRLFGRQIGHVHSDCSVHLSLTKALKASLNRIEDGLPAGIKLVQLQDQPKAVSNSVGEFVRTLIEAVSIVHTNGSWPCCPLPSPARSPAG